MSDDRPVSARGLVKLYGELVAVDHVDLTVEKGDVFGYLGPNGAGKTTSLRMLLGLIRPTEGTISLFGRDPHVDGAKALNGVAGFVEGPTFYPYLTARRNLRLLAAYDDGDSRSRIEELLELVELSDRGDDKVGSGSLPHSCASRSCCCSTSRPPASTQPACVTCATSSAGWRARGSPFCSRVIS
jgi:ABC-2 type transport system ATP-binding protein